VEVIQKNHKQVQDNLNSTAYQNLYGYAFPSILQMQEHMISQVQRPPCLPSSRVALDILQGNDEDIGFEDYLGNENDSPVELDPHVAMEARLGIQLPREH